MNNKPIVFEVIQPVRIRKYNINIEKLKSILKHYKKQSGLSSNEIAQKLNVSLTKVAHYFRSDQSFAISDEYVWDKLKEILNIKTNEFDNTALTNPYALA